MEIGSVSGTTSSAVTATRQPQQQPPVEEQRQAQPQPEQQEAPKPVKNAEGQTTGSVINVTA